MASRNFSAIAIVCAALTVTALLTTVAASAPPIDPEPVDEVAGRWAGPPCEYRDYYRQLELQTDGTFRATDLVSPCPADARCIWSGIVIRSGTWRLHGRRIDLHVEQDDRQARPLPGALQYFSGSQTLEEAVPGASARCQYHPAPTG